MDRRWTALGAAVCMGVVLGCSGAGHAAPAFKHIVLVIQENRTPDNLFGSNPNFEPGVDLATTGTDSHGNVVTLGSAPLASCFDPYHGHIAFVDEYTKGADRVKLSVHKGCDLPPNPQFTYADNSVGTMQPYFDIATNWGFANRMFQTNQGPSYPAHQFLFGGTSAPDADSPLFVSENPSAKGSGQFLPKGSNKSHRNVGCTATPNVRLPVIDQYGSEKSHPGVYPCYERQNLSDLLEAAGLSWRYYAAAAGGLWLGPNSIAHICNAQKVDGQLVCTGEDWDDHANFKPPQFLTDVANCQLPNMSWVTPSEASSDHPGSTDGSGPQWVASIVNAIGQQSCGDESYWQDTLILITWDDWGGWFDHVTPFQITTPGNWGAGYTYGFRVPLMVVSAYTPAGYVSNTTYDFGSLLYHIEQNFGLGFIGPGGDTYANYADYWAAPRGTLAEFTPLDNPRDFTPINVQMDRRTIMERAAIPGDPDPDNDQ